MKLVFDRNAWAEYVAWQDTDAKVAARLNGLIGECVRHPFKGTGKPEPLKNELSGYWSRRITTEDRLVYRVVGKGDAQALEIIQCRYHY